MHDTEPADRSAVSRRTMEIAVAAALVALGLAFMADSWRLGASWSDEGPQSGYFPFYVSLCIVLASAVTLVRQLMARPVADAVFVGRQQLRLVLQVLLPTIVFVALIPFLGIYVAMALFIGAFMRWLGRFRWPIVLGVAILVPLAFFAMFELWFLVPLPKGPLEAALGY